MTKNYYDILGIKRDASPKEVKAAFREKAKNTHPDTRDGSEEAFKEVNEAHKTLSDPIKRSIYNLETPNKKEQSVRKSSGKSSSSIKEAFKDLFNLLHEHSDKLTRYSPKRNEPYTLSQITSWDTKKIKQYLKEAETIYTMAKETNGTKGLQNMAAGLSALVTWQHAPEQFDSIQSLAYASAIGASMGLSIRYTIAATHFVEPALKASTEIVSGALSKSFWMAAQSKEGLLKTSYDLLSTAAIACLTHPSTHLTADALKLIPALYESGKDIPRLLIEEADKHLSNGKFRATTIKSSIIAAKFLTLALFYEAVITENYALLDQAFHAPLDIKSDNESFIWDMGTNIYEFVNDTIENNL